MMPWARIAWGCRCWFTAFALVALALILSLHVPGDHWYTHDVHRAGKKVELHASWFAVGAAVAWIMAVMALSIAIVNPQMIREARRSRLKVIDDDGEVLLIRTPGDGRAEREELGRWEPEQAEEAIEKMVEEKLSERHAAERAEAARKLAKRLDRGLKR